MSMTYGAFNSALNNLYKDDILQLADKKKPFEFDDSLFDAVAKLIYENGGFDISQLEDPAARAVINETLRVLSTAIDSGLPHEVPETVRYAAGPAESYALFSPFSKIMLSFSQASRLFTLCVK